jgi:DNA-binding FadR family transcriptional regulator
MDSDKNIIFEKVSNRQRLSEIIANKIKKAIFEEKLVPGDKLPSEKELAESFGTSRTTTREALRLLEISGLLSIKPGQDGGSFVIQPDITRLQAIVSDLIRAKSLTIEHFTQARMILEPSIVEEVIKNITEEEIELLEQNVDRAESEMKKEEPRLVSNNIIFHKILAECTRNPLIVMVLNLINDFLKSYLRAIAGKLDKEIGYHVVELHKQILIGIKEGKVELVMELMRDHINDINQSLKGIDHEVKQE